MIKPLSDRVLIKMQETETTSESGIILATSKEKTDAIAEVIAVGPGVVIDGTKIPMEVKVGDKIIIGKYAGTEVKYKNEDYIIVKQDDILAIIE